ncbi:phage major tail tube protein [Escherichia coli]
MDGKELVEIDTINMIEKVNGVDRLEQHRRNIGPRPSAGAGLPGRLTPIREVRKP